MHQCRNIRWRCCCCCRRPFNIQQQVDAFLRYPSVQQVEYNPRQNPTRLAITYKTPRRVSHLGLRNKLHSSYGCQDTQRLEMGAGCADAASGAGGVRRDLC
jgi:hypothetical protein